MKLSALLVGIGLIGNALAVDAFPPSALLRVRVFAKSDRATPLRGATVRLIGATQTIAGTTDDFGSYTFERLAEGTYKFQAAKPSYLPNEYVVLDNGRQETQVTLGDSANVDVAVFLAKGAVVDGVIKGVDGEPASDILVTINESAGRQQQVWTDYRGHYRFYGLPPGDYFVSCKPPASLQKLMYPATVMNDKKIDQIIAEIRQQQVEPSAAAGSRRLATAIDDRPTLLGLVPVLYPGTTSTTLAEKLHLEEGDERWGIDFQLLASGVAKVRGTIMAPAEYAGSRAWITASGLGASDYSVSADSQGGSFELTNLPPGRYVVRARLLPAGSASTGAPQRTLAASTEVDVVGDVEGLVLDLRPASALTGRVFLDTTNSVLPGLGGLAITLTRLPSHDIGSPLVVTTDREGLFGLTGIEQGNYAVRVRSAGPQWTGWALQSVRVNGQEALGKPVELLTGTVAQLLLTFARQHSELVGNLRGTPANRSVGSFVIVFPTDSKLWDAALGRVASKVVDSNGDFFFTDLPSGEYFLALLAEKPAGWGTPDVLKEISKSAVSVNILAGQRTVQDLQIRR
jgi:hypothetical protein